MFKTSLLVFLVLLSGAVTAGSKVQTNPPSECKTPDGECPCNTGGEVGANCIKVNIDMGATTPWTGYQKCALKVFADDQSPLVFTPESLHAVFGYTFKRIGNRLLPDKRTPKEVVFSHPDGESVRFVFAEGESLGRPDPGFHVKMDERLMMVDAQGWACTNSPVYYDLYETDGTVRRFLATDMTNERGKLVYIADPRGRRLTPSDMGIDVVLGPDGVRQFLTPSRLADVSVMDDGYDVTVYPLQDKPLKDAVTGLYPLPSVAPVKRLSVRSANGGNRAVVTLRSGDDDPKTYLFDYVRGDWSLTRPSGMREMRDRSVKDSSVARTVKEDYSRDGELLARSEYNYVWKSWGFAATNRIEGLGDATRTTEWTYVNSGGGKGRVATELKSSGLRTEYAYDGADRMVRKTRSGPGMMAEVTTYAYESVDPSDIVPPVDTRPRTVVRTLDGIECERTYYVYSPLTNIVERVGVQGAACGGTNALRMVTAYYPVTGGPLSSAAADGLVKSICREDGRLDLYDYALSSNVWTKTVTHLHELSPSPVSGKTTRDVTLTNARGEVVETRTEAFIGGIWYTIARNRMTYNSEGKRIASENLAGQVTATAWDCCHKISETQPDGPTTTWDYDDEGRMVASSRLIPLDMTNVTWLTTCYEYDGLGRQTATWQTNYAEQVGLPATRTRYDALGRVVARIDTLGNTTTTSYSPDGRTVSVQNPNTSTRITTRSADGELISVVGTAITPEFHTYGILPDGTRWSRTAQGETANSPRFTKRYENLIGQTVREEHSGFRGAVLATVHAYDPLGRLVSTAADYEPVVEYTYDTLGNRIATTRTVGGSQSSATEWRKTETTSTFALDSGSIWFSQSNIVSCSDASIVPQSTATARQIAGLSYEQSLRVCAIDVRGNVTEEAQAVADSAVATSKSVPYATNKSLSLSRYGVAVKNVSVSAVTNTVTYDPLGRQIASTDGRGNTRQTEYNSFGQRTTSIDALGNRTTYAYDQFGNLASVTNPLGNATIYEYDLRGHKTYEGGATYPVRYTYDVFGNKTTMMTYRDESLSPDSGDVTTWLYDEASNCMTNKVYADGLGPKYEYDANGRITKRTWARGVETFYAYDGWGNLTNAVYSDGTPTICIAYDTFGRQIEAHDAAGVTTFAYDDLGANTNETVIGVAGTNTIERFHDSFGRSLGYSLNGERRTTLSYEPDKGRISSMLAAGSTNEFRWSYLPGSDLKETLVYPNGDIVKWEYEPKRDLLTLVSNATHSTYHYTYDEAGRRVSKNDEQYGYNVRDELTLATNVVTGAEFAYCYDDIGNRIWFREFGTNTTYVANNLNQYTEIVRGGVVEHPTFDADGSQTDITTGTGRWLVEYNGENRPVLWTCLQSYNQTITNNQAISMSYDRMGRRVQSGNDTFVYDGYLNMGSTIWDPTEPIATRPLVWLANDTQSYYFHDGSKSVSDLTGGETVQYAYSPFGVPVNVFKRDVSPWHFSSEFTDDILGVVYYNYRHFNFEYGRWLQMDPIAENGGLNMYGFANNDPENHYDRLGRIPWVQIVGTLSPGVLASIVSTMTVYCYNMTIGSAGNYGSRDGYAHCIVACNFNNCLGGCLGKLPASLVTEVGIYIWEVFGSLGDGIFSWKDIQSGLRGIGGSVGGASCEEACKCEGSNAE